MTPPTKLEPRKLKHAACSTSMLDISTAHVRPTTRDWIEDDLRNMFGTLSGANWCGYGWILWVNEDLCGSNDGDGVPADLIQVMRFAYSHGYQYLKLDCDACYVEGLPIYEDDE